MKDALNAFRVAAEDAQFKKGHSMAALTQGLVQVYTGNGKGKTTAAFGAAMRAEGNGFSVAFIQFLKSGSDKKLLEPLHNLTYQSFGKSHEEFGWYEKRKDDTLSPKEVIDGWNYAQIVLKNSDFDLVILEELNVVLLFDFIPTRHVIDVLTQRPKTQEVIITGRGAPQELIDFADLVTEMKEIKHPFQKGIFARKGIDF